MFSQSRAPNAPEQEQETRTRTRIRTSPPKTGLWELPPGAPKASFAGAKRSEDFFEKTSKKSVFDMAFPGGAKEPSGGMGVV